MNVEAVDTKTILMLAEELVDKAREALMQGKNWTREVEKMSTKMDDGLGKLQIKIDDLKMGINMTQGPVDDAIKHANSLEDQAQFLER